MLSKSMKLGLVLLMPFCFVFGLILDWIDMPSGSRITPVQYKHAAISAVLITAGTCVGHYIGQIRKMRSKSKE